MDIIIDTSDVFKQTQSGNLSIKIYSKILVSRIKDTLQPFYFKDISFADDIEYLEELCTDDNTSEKELRKQFDDRMVSIYDFFDDNSIKLITH